MKLKSIFDEGRRRDIRAGIRSGQIDLRPRRLEPPMAEPPPLSAESEGGASHSMHVPAAPSMSDEEVRRKMAKLSLEVDSALQPNAPPEEESEDSLRQARRIKSGLIRQAASMQAQLLATAILSGKLERVKIAHENGADLNSDIAPCGINDNSGNPCRKPLTLALALCVSDIIQYLKKNGARE
ncbi:hypothetical protein L0Y65_06120 [Candidatus Micrarchaeota archaeon]|nr:hypothetical protein [Candidatus Micrarchaeota archaeon]